MAGDNNIPITFSAGNSDLSAYIDKLRVQAMDLNGQLLAATKLQADTAREQLKLINDQIQAMSRKNAMGAAAAREAGTAYPAGARVNGDDTMVRLTREGIETQENMADLIIRQLAQGENAIVIALDKLSGKWGNALNNSSGTSSDAFSQSIGKIYQAIREAGSISQDSSPIPVAESGGAFDQVKENYMGTATMLGGIVGAIAGGLLDGPGGILEGYSKGKELTDDIFGGFAGFEAIEENEVQRFNASRNRYMATAGVGDEAVELPRLAPYGISPAQTMDLMTVVAKFNGTSQNAGVIASDIVTINKATGIGGGTLLKLSEIDRSDSPGDHSLARLVQTLQQRAINNGIMQNKDQAGFNDFLDKFAELHRSFLDKQSQVGTATTMDVISKFNRVGGEFSITDPHGLSNINAVQDGLTNPATDSMKAFSYLQLRSLDPSAGMFDIMKQQEQGLAGPNGGAYLQRVLQFTHELGDDDLGKRTLAGFFPKLKLEAVERLYNKSGELNGQLDQGYLNNLYREKGTYDETAAYYTTDKERSPAVISEGILSDRINGLMSLKAEITQAIREAFSGAVIQVDNGRIIIPARTGEPRLKGNAIQNSQQYKNAGGQPAR
ncbi:hypothetical protein [Chitinophaga arvensicola]|uniref:Uncharacterized protein n=1 Tax=Chitinophaga arvensicola TaxID=29529 RepID=A0A1I0R9J6_9BACT|nr:hypothetical protein [Chitinophaga arvensicola]SEW37441.1 hypothetical protein SAMN04488122_2507 [Chitinophaga arvensicola]